MGALYSKKLDRAFEEGDSKPKKFRRLKKSIQKIL